MMNDGWKKKVGLVDYPDELLQAIFDHLPCNLHLMQVALVSRRFRNLIEPFFYRNITAHPMIREGEVNQKGEPRNIDLFTKIVNRLTERPDLCHHVARLYLVTDPDDFSPYFHDHAQLLRLVPSLRILSIVPFQSHLNLTSLSRLDSLFLDFRALDNIGVDEGYRLRIVTQNFWLPSLRLLHVNHVDLDNTWALRNRHLFPPERRRTSPIVDLRLYGCDDRDIGILPDILISVQELKRLTIEYDRFWASALGYGHGLVPESIEKAIRPHSNTLVELCVAGSDAAEFAWGAALISGFSGYNKLIRLAIPESFLAYTYSSALDVALPIQLEELQLQCAWKYDEPDDKEQTSRCSRMENIAATKSAYVPALKVMTWWFQSQGCNTSFDYLRDPIFCSQISHLHGKFQDIGVDFSWLSEVFLADTPFCKEMIANTPFCEQILEGSIQESCYIKPDF